MIVLRDNLTTKPCLQYVHVRGLFAISATRGSLQFQIPSTIEATVVAQGCFQYLWPMTQMVRPTTILNASNH